MQHFARLAADVVAETFSVPNGINFPDLHHPDIVSACRPCAADVAPGWRLEGGTLVPPPVEAPSQAVLIAYAADLRWRQEVGGIVVGGVSVATDDRAKVMITGARLAASADPEWSTVWHGADGATYPVDAAAMVAISDAVQSHVNSGFATFAAVKAGIEVGAITTSSEIDAAFSG